NGTILANPTGLGLNPNPAPEDQVFASELRIKMGTHNPAPADGPVMVAAPSLGADVSIVQLQSPDGRHVASWEKRAAPVYVVAPALLSWAIRVRQKQFAHVPGGRVVKRGDEPMFLWVRLEVADVIEEVCNADRIFATLTVLAPSLLTGMGAFNNVNF